MKDLKSTLTQHFIISASLVALVLTFLAASLLEPIRGQLAASLEIPSDQLWVPVIALLVGFYWLSVKRLIAIIAQPLQRLAQEAEHGEQGFAFKIKSRSKEEDALKHSIEAAKLRAKEAIEQATDLEEILDSTTQELAESKKKYSDAEVRFSETQRLMSELHFENQKLQGSKLALELTLENERKSKVGAEVEKRAEEIYAQMERAVSAAAYKSIWIPSLVQELKTPVSIINELSVRLQDSWSQTSFTRVNEDIARICEQSQTQLSLLNDILARQPKAPPATHVAVEPLVQAPSPSSPASEHLEEPPSAPEGSSAAIEADVSNVETGERLPEPLKEEPGIAEMDALASQSFRSPARYRNEDSIINAATVARLRKAQTELPSTSSNPDYNLTNILQGLATEFAAIAPDANITYAIDSDLDIEIEDEALLSLLHTLVEVAVSHLREGDITIGVDLHSESIEFDVACDGRFKERSDIDLSQANDIASDLGGEVVVDMPSATELHLSFEYNLASTDDDATIEI